MAKKLLLPLLLALAAPAVADSQKRPKIDLVIALDVSGSMRGLIDATRLKMWDAVRLLGRAKPVPEVRVGIITYGGKYYDRSAGYVRKEIDLTTDLDTVAQRLFALEVRGSQEYVARAVQTATRQMAWDQDSSTLKILFVAGNESAEQDPLVALASALGEARQRGIHVNSIYCGGANEPLAAAWRRVANQGNGQFAAIDHNQSVVAQSSPYDAELAHLSQKLSATYLGGGATGARRHATQLEQDERAKKDGLAVAAERAAAKAGATYANADWDAVDAYANRGPLPELPGELQAMPKEKREAVLATKLAERNDLRARINSLATQREQWLARGADIGGAATGTTRAAAPADTGAVAVAAAPATATPTAQPAPPPASAPAKAAPAVAAKARTAKKPSDTMGDAFGGAIRRNAMESGYSF